MSKRNNLFKIEILLLGVLELASMKRYEMGLSVYCNDNIISHIYIDQEKLTIIEYTDLNFIIIFF